MATGGKVLVYGGRGALGSVIIDYFRQNNWWILNVDLISNDAADANIIVTADTDWHTQSEYVKSQINQHSLVTVGSLDAILCVAGGWAGGNAADAALVNNCDLMYKQSVWSSIICAQLAAIYLKPTGLLQLTGAFAAVDGTPNMIGYGMAKAAVHQLTKSLANTSSGLPEKSCVLAILPVTLDTPMNRKWMPKADFSSWTSLDFIAKTLFDWSTNVDGRPDSGSLIKLETVDGVTNLIRLSDKMSSVM